MVQIYQVTFLKYWSNTMYGHKKDADLRVISIVDKMTKCKTSLRYLSNSSLNNKTLEVI